MRIALLSNVTVEVLAGLLADSHEVWHPFGFNGWMQAALEVPDELKAFDPEAVVLLLDSSHGTVDPAEEESAVASLERALPRATVLVPDLGDLADEVGGFYDERMWTLASMPWSLRALRAIAEEIVRLFRLTRQGGKKVLALDFDNVLWKGVIGEDGLDGIRPYEDFQRGIRDLRARGVLLVGLSRNTAADVEPIWDDPRQVLKKDDFVDLRIDWNEKAANLAAVAASLNLGIDSFVFVDDDPAERALMAAAHPEVTVAEGAVSVRRLARLYFPRRRLTDEDRQRTALYRDEAKRREAAVGLPVEDYLKKLEIRTEIHPFVASEIPRIVQLAQKTNQFNVCTNRLTAEDVARLEDDPRQILFTIRAGDRFGDQGLVGFVRVGVSEEGSGEILDWVLSCRVMNRRLEFMVWAWLERELCRRGLKRVRAAWHQTPKNAPVRDLYEKLGFTCTAETDGVKDYEHQLKG